MAAAAGCTALLAMACNRATTPGARLSAAGSSADDGSGVLAKASIKFLTTDDEGGFEPEPQQQRYADDYYGGYTYGGFGGDWYGGGFGGSMYASYQRTRRTAANRSPSTASSTTPRRRDPGDLKWPKAPKVPATIAAPAGCGNVANDSLRLGAAAPSRARWCTSRRSPPPAVGDGGQKPFTSAAPSRSAAAR